MVDSVVESSIGIREIVSSIRDNPIELSQSIHFNSESDSVSSDQLSKEQNCQGSFKIEDPNEPSLIDPRDFSVSLEGESRLITDQHESAPEIEDPTRDPLEFSVSLEGDSRLITDQHESASEQQHKNSFKANHIQTVSTASSNFQETIQSTDLSKPFVSPLQDFHSMYRYFDTSSIQIRQQISESIPPHLIPYVPSSQSILTIELSSLLFLSFLFLNMVIRACTKRKNILKNSPPHTPIPADSSSNPISPHPHSSNKPDKKIERQLFPDSPSKILQQGPSSPTPSVISTTTERGTRPTLPVSELSALFNLLANHGLRLERWKNATQKTRILKLIAPTKMLGGNLELTQWKGATLYWASTSLLARSTTLPWSSIKSIFVCPDQLDKFIVETYSKTYLLSLSDSSNLLVGPQRLSTSLFVKGMNYLFDLNSPSRFTSIRLGLHESPASRVRSLSNSTISTIPH